MKIPLGRCVSPALICTILLSTATPASPQEVQYYHLDPLGSVRAVTNQAGAVIERHDYLPFGEEWNPQPGTQPKRFTGKERDAETGLDYFGARYYGSKIGRFTTVDPAYTWKENLLDPQRWNRYAYGRNNTLKYTDPDGRVIVPVAVAVALGVFFVLNNVTNVNTTTGPVNETIVPNDTLVGGVFALRRLAVEGVRAVVDAELRDMVRGQIRRVADRDKRGRQLKDGERLRVNEALDAADDFLGEGYKDAGNGRFVSADGLRQVRMGDSDIQGKHAGGPHMNFETLAPNPDKPGKFKLAENKHIFLEE